MTSTLAITYNLRHLRKRPISTGLTCLGIALVIFVFTATQMLGLGVEHTLQSSGSPSNIIVIRSGSRNELQSALSRNDIHNILEVIMQETRITQPTFSADAIVLMNIPKQQHLGGSANVTVRGLSLPKESNLFPARPPLSIVSGRQNVSGTNEVIVGSALTKRFDNLEVGKDLRLAGINWKIVGIFEAGNTSFNSEVWADAEPLIQALRRTTFSSVTVTIPTPSALEGAIAALEREPRLNVVAKREDKFYAEQSEFLAAFIKYLGTFISIVFSAAAVIGSMITMYTAVATRTPEIGILRTLGFTRWSIVRAFIQESLVLAVIGGVTGILAATLLSYVSVGTTNFQTFSDVTFSFILSSKIAVQSFLFAIVMGCIGGALPAYAASRINPLDAVRG